MASHFHINHVDTKACGCETQELLEMYKRQKREILATLRDLGLESPNLDRRTLRELKELVVENT